MLNQNNKFLIIGGDSLIGKHLFDYLKKNNENVFITSKIQSSNFNKQIFLDLQDIQNFTFSDSIVFFCASISNIEECEKNSELTNLINVENTIKLIRKLIRNNCRIIYFSSHAVFNGLNAWYTEKDKTSPSCNYGKQKTIVENEILKYQNNVILRLTKVISKDTPLISNWLKQIKKNKIIYAFDNLYLAPISLSHISNIVFKYSNNILHLSGTNQMSYYQFGKKLLKHIHCNQKLIKPINFIKANKKIYFNPKYCTLKSIYIKNNETFQLLINVFDDLV